MNLTQPLTMSALWRLIARATVGHEHYDRTIRDHAQDARFAHAKGDSYGWAHWGARSIALSLAADRGHRWNLTNEQFDAATSDGAQVMGDQRVIVDNCRPRG